MSSTPVGGCSQRGLVLTFRSQQVHVALRFAGGMFLAMTGPLVLIPILGAAGFFVGGSVLRALAAFVAPSVIGGAIAGWVLRCGWQGTLAFAVAFPVGASVPLFIVTTLPALSGHETVTQLSLGFAGSFSLSYALLGAVGTAVAGFRWRLVGEAALTFAFAGGVGGLILASVVALLAGDGSDVELFRLVGSTVALLIPAAVGGWWLGRLSGLA